MAASPYSMRFNQEDSWRNMEKTFMANEPVLDHGGFAGAVIVQDSLNSRSLVTDRSVTCGNSRNSCTPCQVSIRTKQSLWPVSRVVLGPLFSGDFRQGMGDCSHLMRQDVSHGAGASNKNPYSVLFRTKQNIKCPDNQYLFGTFGQSFASISERDTVFERRRSIRA